MKKKVLVVDDEVFIHEILNEILEYLEYDISFAENWKESLDLLKSENFDILMTDFRMPAMEGISNGIELIRFVKLNKINPEMKIILMSGEMNNSTRSVALAAGANMTISKLEIRNIDVARLLLQNLFNLF